MGTLSVFLVWQRKLQGKPNGPRKRLHPTVARQTVVRAPREHGNGSHKRAGEPERKRGERLHAKQRFNQHKEHAKR